MPSVEKHEGVVLKSIDFKDRQKIITLFTPTAGLISLIIKGINRKKSHLLTLSSPFTQAEYLFTVGKSNLYAFKDGTPLATHHSLRENLSHIEAAFSLAKTLLLSQMPGKPAPDLYNLTLAYLKHLPQFEDPRAMIASFMLKLLKHEGHLALDIPSSPFTSEEWDTVINLTEVRTIKKLKETKVSLSLEEKIRKLLEAKTNF